MLENRSTVVCRDCGYSRSRRKTALCYLGFHKWVAVATAGEHYLECRRCGKYGGSPGSFNWVPNRNRDL